MIHISENIFQQMAGNHWRQVPDIYMSDFSQYLGKKIKLEIHCLIIGGNTRHRWRNNVHDWLYIEVYLAENIFQQMASNHWRQVPDIYMSDFSQYLGKKTKLEIHCLIIGGNTRHRWRNNVHDWLYIEVYHYVGTTATSTTMGLLPDM